MADTMRKNTDTGARGGAARGNSNDRGAAVWCRDCKDLGVRHKRLAALRRIQRKPLLPIDSGSGELFGSLAATIKVAGRQHRYRAQDLWLASQAIQHGFGLLTRNRRDFEDIPGLDLVLYELVERS
jgi:predicted nucleic acid-binding protein